jgi:hypothetical protein
MTTTSPVWNPTEGEPGYPPSSRTRKPTAGKHDAHKTNGRPYGDAPSIIVGTDEPRVINEAIDALTTRDNVYQRGGCLVQLLETAVPPRGIDRSKDAPRIAALRHARIRELLADAAAWLRSDGEGNVEPIHPPDWVVKAVDARGQWPQIRRVEAVVEAPILRADGTVLQQAGYDEATGIIFRPQCDFAPIAKRLTLSDAEEARDSLLKVVCDFPFGSDAHCAAWLAALLTPQARYCFDGPAPLFLVDANVRGCGKSLLVDAISEISSGRAAARMTITRDDEEVRKRITAIALAGEPLILLDNVAGVLGSPSLDAALTATSWSDRLLGRTEMASGIPLFSTWFATGNNIALLADTARRTVHIRLESPEESPEERTGFRHPDLLAWIRTERARLAVYPAIILAAYYAAGRPDMRLTPWGSFEAWSAVVRQAVVWCGLPDPGVTRIELQTQADRETMALRQLIAGWQELDPVGRGLTVVEVLKTLADYPNEFAGLRAALMELAPPKDGRTLNPRSIGMKLHHLRRRVVGGVYLDRRNARQGAVWFVGGSPTNSGTSPSSPVAGNSAGILSYLILAWRWGFLT